MLEHDAMIAAAGNQGGGGITPPPVEGYTIWLDPSDTSTLFSDAAGTIPATNTIRNITDKGSDGGAFTTTADVQRISSLNGVGAIYHDTYDYGPALSKAMTIRSGNPRTVIFVMQHNTSGSSIKTTWGSLYGGSADFQFAARYGNQVRYDGDTVGTFAVNAPCVGSIAWNNVGTSMRTRFNGVQIANKTNEYWYCDRWYLGSFSTLVPTALGLWFGDILVYNSYLGTTDTALIENWLAAKYAITF